MSTAVNPVVNTVLALLERTIEHDHHLRQVPRGELRAAAELLSRPSFEVRQSRLESFVAEYPGLDPEELSRREIRPDTLTMLRHLMAHRHQEAGEPGLSYAFALSPVAEDTYFDGLVIFAPIPETEASLEAALAGKNLSVHIEAAEDCTAVPEAPNGPAAALACAVAMVRLLDELEATAASLAGIHTR